MLNVDTRGIEQMRRAIVNATRELADPTPALKLIGLLGVRAVNRNFRSQKNADGSSWPALRYRSGTPLIDKFGRMPKGITFSLAPRSVTIGAGLATAAYNAVHNYGSRQFNSGARWASGRFKGARKGVPRRQFMYLTAADRQEIVAEVRSFVAKALRGRP